MRKHFLILMLLALLPFVGWAADPIVVKVAFGALETPAATVEKTYAGSTGFTVSKILAGDTEIQSDATYTKTWYKGTEVVTELKDAGTYTLKVTKEGSTFADATLKINRASLYITTKDVATPLVYGVTAANLAALNSSMWEVQTSGDNIFKTGDDATSTGLTVTVDWGTDLNAGTHDVKFTVNALENYNVFFTQATRQYTIAKKPLVVRASAAVNLTYGDVFDSEAAGDQVTYEGFIDGEDETTVFAGQTLQFSTNYEQWKPVATYPWTPSGLTSDNYEISYNAGNIVVAAKDITADDVVIAELADVTYNKTDKKPASVTATFLGKELKAGADKDYQLSYYSNPTIVEETGEITAAGTLLTGDAAKFINAGTYCVKVTANAGGNYTGYVLKKFVVKKKPIGIRTVNKKVTYNGANQASAVSFGENVEIAGLEEGDAYPGIKAAGSTELGIHLEQNGVTVTEAKDAGTYDIKFNDYSGVKFSNYDFSGQISNQGQLTIEQKTIILTANNKSKNYGTPDVYVTGRKAVEEDVTVSYPAGESAITGHTISSYPWLQRAEGEEKADYALNLVENDDNKLVIKSGTTDVTKNYKPQFKPGTFTIGAGVIAIWANTQTITYGKTYGEAKAMLNASIDGMPKKDAEKIQAQVNAALTIKGVSEDLADDDLLPANPAGYDIKFNGEITIPEDLKPNYGEVYYYDISSKFKVNKKALTKITANQQALNEGEAQSKLVVDATTVTVEGAENADDLKAILGAVKLKFADGVSKTGATDPALNAGTGTGWDAETKSYAQGIVFDQTVEFANYTFPTDAEKIIAGRLYVTAAGATLNLDAKTAEAGTANTELIAEKAGQKLNVKIANRTLKAGEWSAMTLPFAIKPFAFCSAIGCYAVFDVMQTSGEVMNFKINIDEIPAYTPFLVKTDATVALDDKTFTGVIVEAVPEGEESIYVKNDAWKFIGTIDYDEVAAPMWYTYSDASGKVAIDKSDDAIKFAGFFGYFKPVTNGTSAAPRIVIEEADGSTTAISAITAEGVAVPAEGWYTINGVKLNGVPTEKGIYINNGKKIVVK